MRKHIILFTGDWQKLACFQFVLLQTNYGVFSITFVPSQLEVDVVVCKTTFLVFQLSPNVMLVMNAFFCLEAVAVAWNLLWRDIYI